MNSLTEISQNVDFTLFDIIPHLGVIFIRPHQKDQLPKYPPTYLLFY